jgi:large subunit ribosomal protein L16
MKIYPNKTKFDKCNKGRSLLRIKSKNLFKNQCSGSIGLKIMKSYKLTNKHIATLYFLLNKLLKKTGRIKMNIFPQIPVTKKPTEIRMGKGKGSVHH